MKDNTRTRALTQLALLAAVELVMAYTPLGYLRTLGLEISFLMIPVTLGAMLIGPAAGAVLGGIFGLTSFATCFGTSAFGTVLLGIDPVLTFLVCVPTRILAGWLAGLLFRALRRLAGGQPGLGAFGAAALTGPVLNTALFMTALVVCFYRTEYIQGIAQTLGAANPLTFVLLFVGIQGLVEAAVGFAACFVIGRAVYKVLRRA